MSVIRRRVLNLFLSLALVAPFLDASQSLLITELSPSILGTGKNYDLLFPFSPMNRTYSGVFGIKSKSEISFNNIFLPNDTSVQNLQFGLGKALIPGLKLGLYALYYNQNGFNIIDERASFVGPADAADIVIGLPLVFDPSSLPFRGKNASTNEAGPTPAEAIFKQISLGVNANYYYSSFDTAHFSSFSFDANLSTRFKVGYIGQPRPVLSAEDLEKEKAGRLRGLGTNKSGADEITALYEGRVADLSEVAVARRDIYKIYNDRYTELRSADVSNYFSTAEGELFQLYQEALKGLTQNENLMQARLTRDIADLSVSIADYREKLSAS
ncbi:MAG: hypothetical protein JNM63_13505, partial [Spirochaetia bacterium]|nr:hypothetical protein [Spirochaetia bacterium]